MHSTFPTFIANRVSDIKCLKSQREKAVLRITECGTVSLRYPVIQRHHLSVYHNREKKQHKSIEETVLLNFSFYLGLPRWLSNKESSFSAGDCLQCRCGSDPCVMKILWRRKWQPTPGSLPGESHGQRSLVGCSPWVCKSQTWISN